MRHCTFDTRAKPANGFNSHDIPAIHQRDKANLAKKTPVRNGVNPSSPNFYAQWRDARLAAALADAPMCPPPERLLQVIWQHQRLRRTDLRATDGQSIRVLHPGFWNHEAGPDFHQAIVQIGTNAPITGDVEVDPVASDWRAHGHAGNPAFGNVILHVIWNGPTKSGLPTLRLQSHLDAPLEELNEWHATEPSFPLEYTGQCRAPLATLAGEKLDNLLQQAAQVRLHAKAESITRLAKSHGWDAALWRGLFRALGYKNNTWPMQTLAESLQHLAPADATVWQARLLGLAGFLNEDLNVKSPAARRHLRCLWDHWWRERDALSAYQLPVTAWRLSGLRPANHPTRRLALLAHWLARGDIPARLEAWLDAACSKSRLAPTLLEILDAPAGEFWQHHWTFRSSRQVRPCPLLGVTRTTDLAINVILPWFHARAKAGRNPALVARIEKRYAQWPPAQDNRVLKLARQRLFAASHRLTSAAHQQGLLQITRDFCDHAPATCEDCRFPDLVRSWPP